MSPELSQAFTAVDESIARVEAIRVENARLRHVLQRDAYEQLAEHQAMIDDDLRKDRHAGLDEIPTEEPGFEA